MLTLDSQLNEGKYKGLTVRQILSEDPHFLYNKYLVDPDFDFHLDVMRAMEKKGFNMRRATLLRMKTINVDI